MQLFYLSLSLCPSLFLRSPPPSACIFHSCSLLIGLVLLYCSANDRNSRMENQSKWKYSNIECIFEISFFWIRIGGQTSLIFAKWLSYIGKFQTIPFCHMLILFWRAYKKTAILNYSNGFTDEVYDYIKIEKTM